MERRIGTRRAISGEELFLSPNTVKSQAVSSYRKLGVSNRSQAVTQSRQLGLLEA
ncbi:MAG: helix-turn-helix transcriptional regulator [Trebonia sp.]